ncbi:antirestriction protein ArdA [Rhodospirillum sp. A1_3_36]|uniref:antirestriction protein ArdA n=1 Tax=Rhodospirillum sp. A1_3_36 TaxID=3391666 RepID=UPI0039A51EE7
MTITLYAQPYNIDATGFYFDSIDHYQQRASLCRDGFGQPAEEFEIQFIDGERLDAALALAWDLHQGSFPAFLEAAETWDDDQKRRFIIAVGECGYDRDQCAQDPDAVEIDLYQGITLCELAGQFVEEGLFGDIPEPLRFYIDYDAIARDLSMDYSETEIAGETIIYRCA